MIYNFDGHELDTGTQELRRAGELVHIEPQVFAVLEHLITNRRRVVTKIELLDEVWGDRFVSESALTSRIKSVRSVCGDTGREQRVVRTVHGRGYRFVADVAERDPACPPAPSDLVSTPRGGLVGRTEELARLESALAAAASGRRQAVFVTGEVGAGKSAILAELLERNDDPDAWHVLRGQCLQSRGSGEPYFCLLDALTRLSRTDSAQVIEVLERVAPTWLAQIPSLVDDDTASRLERRLLGSTSQRMLREGAEAIEDLARARPVVLALEDLQWADDCALDVLELLLQRSEPAQLLIVGTARTEPAPVSGLIAAMTAGGRATELRLSALDTGAIDALVGDWFDGAVVPDEVLDVVNRRCDGIPLFVQETLATWVREDLVDVIGGELTTLAPLDQLEATVPDNLRLLIERELDGIDPADIVVLESAAVAGLEFDGAAVAAGLRRPLAEVEVVLSTMTRQLHYLDTLGAGSWPDGTISTRFSFTHDLHRQVVYERISATHRSELHAAVGEAVERGHQTQLTEVIGILAHHFVNAGDAVKAIEYLRRSGEQAAARNAHSHASGFLLDALARVDRLQPGLDRDRAELRVRMALGPTLVATRGWFGEEVSENYERAMELSASEGQRADAGLARYGLATVTELRGEYGRTEELLLPLLEAAADDVLVEARELMACSTFHQGAFQRSVDNAHSVLDSWEKDEYSVLMSRMAEHPAAACNSWASLASWFLGHSDESLLLAARAVEIGEQNLYALSTARVQCAFLHQFRDEVGLCGEWADAAMALAEQQGFPMRAIQATMLRGWVDAATGTPDDGAARIADGLRRYRSLRARLSEPYFLGLQAEAQLFASRADHAMHLLDEATVNMNETTRSFFYAPELHRLKARAHLQIDDQGAVAAAREALDLGLADAQRLGSPPLEMRVTTDRLQLENEHGDPERWREALAGLVAQYQEQADTVDVMTARALLDT